MDATKTYPHGAQQLMIQGAPCKTASAECCSDRQPTTARGNNKKIWISFLLACAQQHLDRGC